MAMVVLALLALPVSAPRAAGYQPVLLAESERREAAITPDRAAEIARRATGGRVLRVDRRGNGHGRYRVKVLVDGQRVRHVVVDAQSGRVRE